MKPTSFLSHDTVWAIEMPMQQHSSPAAS